MATTVLRSAPSAPHVGRIEFGPTRRARAGWAGTATVEYDGEIWSVDLDIIDAYLSDMVGFFEEIARPDWSGSARWQSEFSEVTVEAEHAPDDLVRLGMSVWWKDGDELDNERRGELLIRAAEVSNFAAGLRELTGFHGPADRFRPA